MKKIISMILVGGKGTRLKDMTKSKAKPAISFGAKYRLIDFTLSNLSHSNIDTVGMITQYEPMELMSYIGNGASWDLDYTDGDNIEWQKGTGHAVKQFFDFVEHHQPKYVMILPGDHIYKMDYNPMIDQMEKEDADLLIATTRLKKDLHRFGVIEVNEQHHVTNFIEKPENPTSDLVSMGIYIFKKEVLESLLFNENELLDFGHDIIPEALHQHKHILSYEFKGYWRDVGTVQSLYEANMDMLDDPEFLGLNSSKNLSIFSRSLNLNPHVVAHKGLVHSSVIADGCWINGEVIHSSIAYRVRVEEGALIKDSCVLQNCLIDEGVHIENVMVNEGVHLPKHYHAVHDEVVLITKDNLTHFIKIIFRDQYNLITQFMMRLY